MRGPPNILLIGFVTIALAASPAGDISFFGTVSGVILLERVVSYLPGPVEMTALHLRMVLLLALFAAAAFQSLRNERNEPAQLLLPLSCLWTLAFFAALRLPVAEPASFVGSGSWPHFHVLLSSAGLSLLGLAALAGALFLAEHRRVKARRAISPRLPLPSLEALDRTNAVALAVGFLLLTLGVVTGMMWVQTVSGRLWTASPHQILSALAWAVCAVLAGVRFGSRQGARQAAAMAVPSPAR